MAHWRDGGIGNMPGSDDRPIEEWTLLEKLACLATQRTGAPIPKLLEHPNGWGEPLSAIAQAAFDEIVRLRGVDIKLRLTEGHYRDALNLLGETQAEVMRLRGEFPLRNAEMAKKGGAA